MLTKEDIKAYCDHHGLQFWELEELEAATPGEWEDVVCAGVYPDSVQEMSGPLAAVALLADGTCSVIWTFHGETGDETRDVTEDEVRSGKRLHAAG